MSKYNVIITSAADSKVVNFVVTREVPVYSGGRWQKKVGTRSVQHGAGMVVGTVERSCH